MPRNALIAFAYADFAESHKEMEKAVQIYEKLLLNVDDPTIVQFWVSSRSSYK